jgi:flavin-dependent dehydrogenase
LGRRIDADVLVAGGGPAGSSCALRLSQYGQRVLLFDLGHEKRQHVGESLPSSIRVVFSALGVDLPPEVMVQRPPTHLVYWGEMQGGSPWADVPDRESSLLVWRGPFDRFLREAAVSAGARLLPDAVSRVSRSNDGVAVRTVSGAELRGRFFVDATGRSGVLARSYRRKEGRFRTLALTGHFRTEESSPPTIVEAFENGWVWTAPLANGLRDVTAMVDASEGADRTARFSSALESARNVRGLVSGAAREGPLRGIDATPYGASRFCGSDFLLVGDAASFLDPLSAHGVHKAMDGALLAAVAARTILERPERASDAAEFYNQRESSIYRVTTERLRALYRQETRFQASPFWKNRSEGAAIAADALPAPRPPLDTNRVLQGCGGLAEAPVVEGDFIERREVLVAPGQERPVRFLGSVCLPDLYRDVLATGSAREAARRSPAGLERALAAVDWLYRAGYLELRDSPEL